MAFVTWAACAVLISALWVTIYHQVQFERGEAISSAVRDNQNRAMALEQYVARTLGAADLAARYVAEKYKNGDPDRRGAGATGAPALLADPVISNPLFAAVVVVDRKGDVVATTMPSAPALNIAGRATFRALRQSQADQLVVGKSMKSALLDRVLVGLSRRINRPDGSFGGNVIVQLDVQRLMDLNGGSFIRPNDLIAIVGLDGLLRARRTGTRFSFGDDLRGKPVMAAQARHPNGTSLAPGSLDGIMRYFSHRRLEHYPLFVSVGVSEADVLRDVRERAAGYYLAGAALTIAALAFALFLSFTLVRRERAARDLAATNSRLRKAQQIARIGDWQYDFKRDLVVWSDELCAMYGRDARDDRLSTEQLFGYFDAPSQAAFKAMIDKAVQSEQPQECDLLAELADGISHRRVTASPARDSAGQVSRLVGTDQDISSAKLHESLQNEVAHLARVDVMNTMAATIAHELNQPLAAATNYLSATRRIVDRGRPGEEDLLKEGLSGVQHQIALAGNIIRRTREMMSSKTGHSDRVSLADIVNDAFALALVTRDANPVALRQRLAPDALWVVADKVQIQQVLMNLVRNGCEAAISSDRPEVVVSSERSGDGMVRICVSDNGPGIASEAGDLFAPFASSKAKGLGLGLAISRTIVEAHQGRIWTEATQGKGARVCFTLPVASATADTRA